MGGNGATPGGEIPGQLVSRGSAFMQKRNVLHVVATLTSLVLVGCVREPIRPATYPEEPGEPGAQADSASRAGYPPSAGVSAPPPLDGTPPAAGTTGEVSGDTPAGASRSMLVARYPELSGPPLPELAVKSFGLHLGGGARDDATRDAYLRQLEHGFPDYLECYRELDVPGKEGTFGADLRIDSQGGRPRVEQTRTKLSGDDFKQCMVRSIEALRFKAPPSGRALMISYSIKFSFVR
jgi:hypothetical protein